MKKKGKSKTSHKKNEEKGEYESLKNESFLFQRGYPNHDLTIGLCVFG
jgi:hypothetical protein